MQPPVRQAAAWIGVGMGLAGVLAFLFPDGSSQDGGTHYLFARWAWVHPEFFVGVWSRPVFTFLYAFPALLGYSAAKLFTVLVCGACAWQTWKVAAELGAPRAPLVVPLLFFQPAFLLLSSETMTEPLFALLLITAVRLHLSGRTIAGLGVASFLVPTRPEGFAISVVWAAWVLLDRRDPRPWRRRLPALAWLGTGTAAWWLAALIISGDPLYIPRTWPEGFSTLRVLYGSGPLWGYAARIPEVCGPLFVVPMVLGLRPAWRSRARALILMMGSVVTMHSILWWTGAFGTAGYSRYLVTVSPAFALATLYGWSLIADRFREGLLNRAAQAAAILASAAFALLYIDGWPVSRDAAAIDAARAEFDRLPPRPVRRLVWSQAYMAIRFDADPWSSPPWGDRARNLQLISTLPSQTLVFWDQQIGPVYFHLTDADFARAGFERLFAKSHDHTRRWGPREGWIGIDGPRPQEMVLLYRP